MNPVKSSNISAVGYDPSTKILEIHFKNGSKYEYRDVPPEAYEALMNAKSVGSHFHAHVKTKYLYREKAGK